MKLSVSKTFATFLMLFVFAIATISATGQNADFSGKWKLNTEKSKLNAEFSMAPKQVNITQNTNDLSLERLLEFRVKA
jgi:hypothetical protein